MPEYSKHVDSWEAQAACLGHPDPEIFHPIDRLPDISRALAVCAKCPVTRQCFQLGKELRATGIWGGKLRRVKP
jgi:hypothetical protein